MKKLINLFVFFFLFSCNEKIENSASLILNENFGSSQEIKLKNWKFYWNDYITSSKQVSNYKKSLIVTTPGTWRGNYFKPNLLPPKGFGTYKFSLRFDKLPKDSLAILFNDINSCGEIWINGELKIKRGNFTKTESKNFTSINPILLSLPKEKDIEICIPIAHYNHRMGGGMLDSPVLSTYTHLEHKLKMQTLFESISTIIVLLISIFSLIFYFIGSKRAIFLYFGLMCLIAMLRQVVIGVGILSFFFDSLPFTLVQTFRYIGFYLGIGIGALYFNKLYPEHISKKVTNYILIISLVFTIYAIITSNFYASYSAIPFQLFGLISTTYVLVKFYFVLKGNDEMSRFTLVSLAIFLITVVNDILYTQLFLPTGYIQHIGFLLFALIQLYILLLFYKKQTLQIIELSEKIKLKEKQIKLRERDIDYLALDNVNKQLSKKEIIEDLNELIKKTDTSNIHQIKRSIQEYKNEILIEESSQKNILNTEQINAEFIDKLQNNFPQLSKSEIEICVLIRLNYSTKEIALKRRATESAIKVAKHRIRKKVNVNTSQELEKLLQNF